MKKVITYETPEVTVFEIHTEGTLCQSYGEEGAAGRDGRVEVVDGDY